MRLSVVPSISSSPSSAAYLHGTSAHRLPCHLLTLVELLSMTHAQVKPGGYRRKVIKLSFTVDLISCFSWLPLRRPGTVRGYDDS